MRYIFFLALFSGAGLFGACDDAEPTPAVDPFACNDSADFAVGQPLLSPVFDPAQGGLLIPAGDSFVIHTTQLVNDPTAMPLFGELVTKISAELAKTDGLIAVGTGSSEVCGYSRTLAIWADEASMYKFVGSAAHAEAMNRTKEVSSSGRVTHWTANLEEVNGLTWEAARARLSSVEESALYK